MTPTHHVERSLTVNGSLAREALEARLAVWSFDSPGAQLSFAGRLARENGWSMRQSDRVIQEYRRFLLLAVTAGHPVCPSEAVDQAWHLHLLDSRAYWEEFCPQVLGQPLHHSPAKGAAGERERERLREWYRCTLARYEETFGERPPTDIWPTAQERFRVDQRWQRLETSRCWIVQRPVPPWSGGVFRRRWPVRSILALLGLGVSGCAAIAPSGAAFPLSLKGPEFLLLYGLLSWMGLALVQRLTTDPGRAQGQGLTTAPNLSPLEMALLAGGELHAVKTEMLRLVLEGRVKPVGQSYRALASPTAAAPGSPLERELLSAMKNRPMPGATLLWEVAKERELFTPLRESLQQQGLMRGDAATY